MKCQFCNEQVDLTSGDLAEVGFMNWSHRQCWNQFITDNVLTEERLRRIVREEINRSKQQ